LVLNKKKFIESFFDDSCKFSIVTHGRCLSGKGFFMGERAIPDHLIHLVESGSYMYQIGKENITLKAKQVLWLQPGVKHSFWQNPDEPKTSNLYIRFYLGNKTPQRLKENFLYFNDDSRYYSILTDMLPIYQLEKELEIYRLRSLMANFAANALNEPEVPPTVKSGLKSHQKKLAMGYIYDNLTGRFQIRDLAEKVKMNPVYFARMFKISFGATPQDWIKKERVRLGTSLLLESKYTVSEIAYQLGYEDIYFFSRQFKEVTGVSPQKWREGR